MADDAVTQLCALFNEVLDDDEAVSAVQIMQTHPGLVLRALRGEPCDHEVVQVGCFRCGLDFAHMTFIRQTEAMARTAKGYDR